MADSSAAFDEPPVDPEIDLGLSDGEGVELGGDGAGSADLLLATARFDDTLEAIDKDNGTEEDLGASTTARLDETANEVNGGCDC
jgi:hypothetical protein